MDFTEEFDKLSRYLEKIRKKFLLEHLENSLESPEDYDLDVRSYCILCHAGFEEFAESLSLGVMSKAIKDYIQKKELTLPIITLLHFKSSHNNYLDSNKENLTINDIETIYNYNRQRLDEVKSKFSNEIFSNHGASLKYLRAILMPVAIDIPKDVNWNNSLDKLANIRGRFAHKFQNEGRVILSVSPEEAETIVKDCTAMFEEIKNRAQNLF